MFLEDCSRKEGSVLVALWGSSALGTTARLVYGGSQGLCPQAGHRAEEACRSFTMVSPATSGCSRAHTHLRKIDTSSVRGSHGWLFLCSLRHGNTAITMKMGNVLTHWLLLRASLRQLRVRWQSHTPLPAKISRAVVLMLNKSGERSILTSLRFLSIFQGVLQMLSAVS